MIHKEARSALAKYIESIVCDESKWSMYKDTDPEKYPFRGGISYNGDVYFGLYYVRIMMHQNV